MTRSCSRSWTPASRTAAAAAFVLGAIGVLTGAGFGTQAVSSPTATASPFSIADVIAAPFPSDIVAAPSGQRVAWVFNDRGRRNVWLAEGPSFAARKLTGWDDDDGQELTSLTWVADGRSLVVVRGGAPNRQGEIPNPASAPQGVEQAIWLVPVEGAAARRLAAGNGPAISPKHDRIAYVMRGQIWSVSLAPDTKPEQLVSARGQARSLRWSPDGARLAFVSGRGMHAFVGVYDVAAKSVRFVDASVDRDDYPLWSPDGARIVFVRQPVVPDLLPFLPQRDGEPWSLQIADAATGRSRELWRADKGRGSVFHALDGGAQLFWSADDRLVFPWESDGWSHLYSLPVSGGSASLLTPGDGEVESGVLASDRRSVLYVSNQGDINRRHIWRVAATGGRPTAVTAGAGIEWLPAALADGQTVAFAKSDARMPAHVEILTGGGASRPLAPETLANFPAASLVEPQAVTIAAADGMSIPAQLFLPRGARAGDKRPAAIFFHGGSRRQMLLGWHYMLYYHHAYALNQYLASRGYVVLSVNYRSGIGYGMEFREAIGYGAAGASEFNDVVGAGQFLRGRPEVDPARIALWGGSYGGYLTALGLSRAPHLFATGVDLHGVHDWNVVINNFAPTYDPEKREDVARLASLSSPMASIAGWKAPVLVIHGDDDRNVPFSETVTLVAKLRAQGVEVEQLVFPDEVHSFLRHEHWLRAYTAAAEFLERRLGRTAVAPPSQRQ